MRILGHWCGWQSLWRGCPGVEIDVLVVIGCGDANFGEKHSVVEFVDHYIAHNCVVHSDIVDEKVVGERSWRGDVFEPDSD